MSTLTQATDERRVKWRNRSREKKRTTRGDRCNGNGAPQRGGQDHREGERGHDEKVEGSPPASGHGTTKHSKEVDFYLRVILLDSSSEEEGEGGSDADSSDCDSDESEGEEEEE